MLQTAKQRRWFFANHPEYSNSEKSGKGRKASGGDKKTRRKGPRRETVDEYVNRALKRLDEPVAAFVKSANRYFETDQRYGKSTAPAYPSSTKRTSIDEMYFEHLLNGKIFSAGRSTDRASYRLAQHVPEFPIGTGLPGIQDFGRGSQGILPRIPGIDDRMPTREPMFIDPLHYHGTSNLRLPTVEEFARNPGDIVRWADRMTDDYLATIILAIDRNKPEGHHRLVRELKKYFKEAGLKINDYVVELLVQYHRLKPDGIHTGKGPGGDYNEEWRLFRRKNPPSTEGLKDKIIEKLAEMDKKYRIEELVEMTRLFLLMDKRTKLKHLNRMIKLEKKMRSIEVREMDGTKRSEKLRKIGSELKELEKKTGLEILDKENRLKYLQEMFRLKKPEKRNE